MTHMYKSKQTQIDTNRTHVKMHFGSQYLHVRMPPKWKAPKCGQRMMCIPVHDLHWRHHPVWGKSKRLAIHIQYSQTASVLLGHNEAEKDPVNAVWKHGINIWPTFDFNTDTKPRETLSWIIRGKDDIYMYSIYSMLLYAMLICYWLACLWLLTLPRSYNG